MAPTPVQRAGNAATASSISIGSGQGWVAPTAGNLLLVSANSDATVTGPTGAGTWTTGPTVVDGNGTYAWYKIATGTETTMTFTPSVSDTIAVTACEYSGVTGLDLFSSSTTSALMAASTTAQPITTTVAGDLIVVFALIHGTLGGTVAAPTGPSWSNGFTEVLTSATGGTSDADVFTFVGEQVVGAAGSYSSVCSWTNNRADRQHFIIAFKAAVVQPLPQRPHMVPQAVSMSANW